MGWGLKTIDYALRKTVYQVLQIACKFYMSSKHMCIILSFWLRPFIAGASVVGWVMGMARQSESLQREADSRRFISPSLVEWHHRTQHVRFRVKSPEFYSSQILLASRELNHPVPNKARKMWRQYDENSVSGKVDLPPLTMGLSLISPVGGLK